MRRTSSRRRSRSRSRSRSRNRGTDMGDLTYEQYLEAFEKVAPAPSSQQLPTLSRSADPSYPPEDACLLFRKMRGGRHSEHVCSPFWVVAEKNWHGVGPRRISEQAQVAIAEV